MKNKTCSYGMEIQSLLFDKEKFTESEAKTWCKKHGFKTEVDITENNYRFRQQEPELFVSFKTTDLKGKLPAGVKAIVACPEEEMTTGGEINDNIVEIVISDYNRGLITNSELWESLSSQYASYQGKNISEKQAYEIYNRLGFKPFEGYPLVKKDGTIVYENGGSISNIWNMCIFDFLELKLF